MSAPKGAGAGEVEKRLDMANRLPSVAIVSLVLVALTAGAAILWPLASRSGQATVTAGPMSNHHRLLEAECNRCHGVPLRGVADGQCMACHPVDDHAAAMPALAAAHPERAMRCAGCHKEHHGQGSLVPTESPLCTDCHSQIDKLVPGTHEVAIDSLARHPEFAPLRGKPRPRAFKFSHAQHLTPPPGAARVDPRACGGCHAPSQDGTTFAPIAFGKDCASCHHIDLDGRLKGRRVAHGSSDRALETIAGELARIYVALGPAAPSREQLDVETRDLEKGLYTEGGGCERCHDVTALAPAPAASSAKSAYDVVSPKIPARWLPGARFSHARHRTTPCNDCHVASETSTSVGDVLLPGIDRCRACHADPGTPGKVESPCISCHGYHRVR